MYSYDLLKPHKYTISNVRTSRRCYINL